MAIELPPQIANGHNLLAWIVGCADDDFGGFSVYISLDGTTYTKILQSTAKSTIGRLTTQMNLSGSEYDAGLTVDVDFSEGPGDNVIGTTAAACQEGANMCIVGGEWCSFRDATLIGPNQYRLTGWRRAWYDTDQAVHAIGTRIGIVPLDTLVYELPRELVGQVIFTKSVPINLYGQETDISTVPALAHYLEGRGLYAHNDPGQSYMGVAGEAITHLDLCELRTDGLIYKATRTSDSMLGLSLLSASAGGKVFVIRLGLIDGPGAATPSMGYLPSTLLYPTSTAGQITDVPEAAADFPVAMVGTYGEVFVDCQALSPAGGAFGDHSLLSNLNWAAAGHTMDARLDMNSNIVDEVSHLGIGAVADANELLHITPDYDATHQYGLAIIDSYSQQNTSHFGIYVEMINSDSARTVDPTQGLVFSINAYGVVAGVTGAVNIKGGGGDLGDAGYFVAAGDPLTDSDSINAVRGLLNLNSATAGNIGRTFYGFIDTDEFTTDVQSVRGLDILFDPNGGSVDAAADFRGINLDMTGITTYATAFNVYANADFPSYLEGNLGLGTNAPTAKLDINSDIFRVRVSKTPANGHDTGNAGDHCWDANYFYVCTAANYWTRAALAHW